MGQTDVPEMDDLDNEPLYLNFWYDPITDTVIYQLADEDVPSDYGFCEMCERDYDAALRSDGHWRCARCETVWNG